MQLSLGMVQFGVPYWITNQVGQVPQQEVIRILDLAAGSGTGFVYSSGFWQASMCIGTMLAYNSLPRLISIAGLIRAAIERKVMLG